jgi:hypothetical protein
MKTKDILNEKPSVADVKKQQNRSMTQKADDFMRKSFLQKSIDTLQGATGRRGVAPTELEPKYKIVKKKKEKGAVKGEPQAQAPAQAPKPSSGFPVSKTGVELKPGDNVTYQNAKGQMKDGIVTVMLKTRDKQGDLQIQLKKGPAVFAVDRQNIRTANSEPWEYDPKTPDIGKVKESLIFEGGNIFKVDGVPVTQRIKKDDIDPTLDWVEKITGLAHKDMKLGSTGIKSDSGDIDVAVNQAEVNKEQLYQKLVRWAETNHPDDEVRSWVAKSGNNVHFKAPIRGNEKNGFAQLDLMFGDPEFMKFAMRGSGDGTPYKGKHRMILIASIAKAQGMKWSPAKGLVNRDTNEVIARDPAGIAKNLLGNNATPANLDSVETIIKFIKGRPDYDALVADAKEQFAKDQLDMPESVETLGDKHLRRLKELL